MLTTAVNVEVPESFIYDVIGTVFESSVSWIKKVTYNYPEGMSDKHFKRGGEFYDSDNGGYSIFKILFMGGSMTLKVENVENDDSEFIEFKLDQEAINKGLQKLANKDPQKFLAMLEDHDLNDDCHLMEVIVYGELVFC